MGKRLCISPWTRNCFAPKGCYCSNPCTNQVGILQWNCVISSIRGAQSCVTTVTPQQFFSFTINGRTKLPFDMHWGATICCRETDTRSYLLPSPTPELEINALSVSGSHLTIPSAALWNFHGGTEGFLWLGDTSQDYFCFLDLLSALEMSGACSVWVYQG